MTIRAGTKDTTEEAIPSDMEIGIGTWAWGDTMLWGYGRGYGEREVEGAFRRAWDAGIRFFDTAELYGRGQSERLLGRFLRETDTKPFIATKFAPLPWRIGKRPLLNALRASLKRLGLPRVDLYQIHWPLPLLSMDPWLEALADAVELGLSRAVGVSNFNAEQTRRAFDVLARRGIPLATNQVEYSLLQRKIEHDGTMKACDELGVKVVAYSPLGMGLLAGKYTPGKPPPGARAWRLRGLLEQAQPLVSLLREIGSSRGKTPAQVAINWAICQGAVPIPGAKNAGQAAENVGAVGWRLSKDELAALDEESRRVHT